MIKDFTTGAIPLQIGESISGTVFTQVAGFAGHLCKNPEDFSKLTAADRENLKKILEHAANQDTNIGKNFEAGYALQLDVDLSNIQKALGVLDPQKGEQFITNRPQPLKASFLSELREMIKKSGLHD